MNIAHFWAKHTDATHDFWQGDQFPLDDESIAEVAINAMLLIMNNGQRARQGVKLSIDDYGPLVGYGVRFPWKDRITLCRDIDLVNDELPPYAVIGLTRNDKGVFAQAVFASSARAPQRLAILRGAKKVYRVGIIRGYSGLSRQYMGTNESSNDIESLVEPEYAGVMPDGICVGSTLHGRFSAFAAELLAYVVGLHNDRKYFWEVTAVEDFMQGLPAKAHFSIDEEYVKSLFYARSVPLTASGRLRPILHWVQAHQRRIKAGIDIDVRKHLRGIDAFSMHDVNFYIGSPKKAATLRGAKA